MSEWASNEVEIVFNKNNNEDDDGSCGYVNSCYRSDLKAYESLMQDGHSGMSFSITPKGDILRPSICWKENEKGEMEEISKEEYYKRYDLHNVLSQNKKGVVKNEL